MDDIYYQKYLKYKNKYLSLKADIDDQYAGADIVVSYKVKAKVTNALAAEMGSIPDEMGMAPPSGGMAMNEILR